MKRLRKALIWLLCAVLFTGAVACSGQKSASGKNAPGIKTQQAKPSLTHGKHREKVSSSPDCTPDEVVVENNYLSSKQIDAWSAEMKQCQAGGGDCSGIITRYEELSTAQQKQLISDCATSPATCQQQYGDVLADSMAVKQAMGEDIPIKMVYDLTATWAHQMDADGIVASNKVSEQIMAKYGLDQAQADIIAGVALSALGGVSKSGKQSYQPNQGAIGNMKELLTQPGFGSKIKNSTQKTSQMYQGQSVYKATDSIGSTIKKGDQFYLDGQHKNHLEVFDSKGKFKAVLNLDGSVNKTKTEAAKGRKL